MGKGMNTSWYELFLRDECKILAQSSLRSTDVQGTLAFRRHFLN
jgi:hypothetical protein